MYRYGVDRTGLGKGFKAWNCEHENVFFFVKDDFLEYVSNYQLFKYSSSLK